MRSKGLSSAMLVPKIKEEIFCKLKVAVKELRSLQNSRNCKVWERWKRLLLWGGCPLICRRRAALQSQTRQKVPRHILLQLLPWFHCTYLATNDEKLADIKGDLLIGNKADNDDGIARPYSFNKTTCRGNSTYLPTKYCRRHIFCFSCQIRKTYMKYDDPILRSKLYYIHRQHPT